MSELICLDEKKLDVTASPAIIKMATEAEARCCLKNIKRHKCIRRMIDEVRKQYAAAGNTPNSLGFYIDITDLLFTGDDNQKRYDRWHALLQKQCFTISPYLILI